MKNYDSLTDALTDLKKRGYNENFEATTFCLYCSGLDLRLNPEAFHVDEIYRFEGDSSSAEDNSVLYAISSSNGIKGTLVDGYGSFAENMSFDMVRKLLSRPAAVN